MPTNLKNVSRDVFVGILSNFMYQIIVSVIGSAVISAITQFFYQNLLITVAVFFAVLAVISLILARHFFVLERRTKNELKDLQSLLTGEAFEPVPLDLEGFYSMYLEAKSKKLVPYRNLTTEGFLNYRRELPRGHIRLIVPFDIVVDPEDDGGHGAVGIFLEPTSKNEEQSFTNRARVKRVKSVFILLTAKNALTTWKGCKMNVPRPQSPKSGIRPTVRWSLTC